MSGTQAVLLAAPPHERVLYRLILAGADYDVRTLEDAREARAWVRWPRSQRVVLVISDRANGETSVIPLLRALCVAFPNSYLVLCTGSRALGDEAYQAGVFAVVREPLGGEALLEAVRQAWQHAAERVPVT